MFLIAGGVGINPLASIYLHIYDLMSKWNWINQSIYIKNLDKDGHYRKENLGKFLTNFPLIAWEPEKEPFIGKCYQNLQKLNFRECQCSNNLESIMSQTLGCGANVRIIALAHVRCACDVRAEVCAEMVWNCAFGSTCVWATFNVWFAIALFRLYLT